LANITVKQIVTHQSGLPEIWDSQEICCLKTVKLFPKIKELLLFLNLVRIQRHQTNYLLLGMLIEKISGQSFEKFITENQYKSGMKNSIKAEVRLQHN
jgi:CubicO group peptidase (beta-lactamase class C family)